MGLFSKIKEGLKKTKEKIAFNLNKLFTGGVLDDDFYDELEMILLSSDIGAETTERILDELRDKIDEQLVRDRDKAREILKHIMIDILDENELPEYEYPLIITVVGVNGVGKTTTIGKLAHKFRTEGHNVLVVAADTFRAAAADQLTIWSERAGARIVKQNEGADPGSVVFDALSSARSKNNDVILIDTAGRLHNKKNLIEELKKIERIIDREMPSAMRLNYLVVDATTGQNALSQVEVFDEAVNADGIVLTKLDGTAKGGVVLAIAGETAVPVVYIGVGEAIDDLQNFDSTQFIDAIFD